MVSLDLSKITAQDLQSQLARYNDDRGHVIIATTSTFFSLACLSVALRFMTKRIRHIKFHQEDILILVALVWLDETLKVLYLSNPDFRLWTLG